MTSLRSLLLPAGVLLALGVPALAQGLALETTIAVPGNRLESFDASAVDRATGRYYLADRSNGALDVVDIATRRLVTQIRGFVGAVDRGPRSGPDGIVILPDRKEIWVGDGDSSIKVVAGDQVIARIPTGGEKRVDGLAYDQARGLVLAVNNADEPPFLSLVSVADRAVIAKVPVPEATDGVEQPVFVAQTGMFYASVPAFGGTKDRGAVAVFDPVARRITRFIENQDCLPAGLAQGPGTDLVLGCDAGSDETKLPALTLVLDVATGAETPIHEVGSSDQVWYSPEAKLYFVAARGMPGGPMLGVIDAVRKRWVESVPTVPRAYSVAATDDARTVLMPFPPSSVCPEGCIAVFSPKRP